MSIHHFSPTLRRIIVLAYVAFVRPSRVDEDHLVIQGSGRSSGVGAQVAG